MLSTKLISFKTHFTELNMALTGFYGSNGLEPTPGLPILLSETTPYPLITGPDLQFSRIRGNSFLFASVEPHPLTKRLFCAFLCPVSLWILLSRDTGTKESQNTPANQTNTGTQKTQSRTQFHPHGFILPPTAGLRGYNTP